MVKFRWYPTKYQGNVSWKSGINFYESTSRFSFILKLCAYGLEYMLMALRDGVYVHILWYTFIVP